MRGALRPVRLKVPTDSIGMCLMPYALRVAPHALCVVHCALSVARCASCRMRCALRIVRCAACRMPHASCT